MSYASLAAAARQDEPVAQQTGGRRERGRLRCWLACLAGACATALAALAWRPRSGLGRGPRSGLEGSIGLVDWSRTAQLPPWLSPIEEGAQKAVAIVLGQALRPDGEPSRLLADRARRAKGLLDDGTVEALIVSGSDPAGVGHTEASAMRDVLESQGVPRARIIMEAQATTTAENAWFAMRWIPKGTGQLHIVTSEFHMPRARYVVEATLNHFYRLAEELYEDSSDWKSESKRYPRLTLHEAPAASFCRNSSRNKDGDPKADISEYSLAYRAADELSWLASGRVARAMYGPPLSRAMWIWAVPVNVSDDPDNEENLERAIGAAMNTVGPLCACTSPPEHNGTEVPYPLKLPVSSKPPSGKTAADWERVKNCSGSR